MAQNPDPERQRRKRRLRVVSRRDAASHVGSWADPAPASRTGRRRRSVPRPPLAAALTLVAAVAVTLLWNWLDPLGRAGEPRMARYPEAPAQALPDLLYLSYLDSLARDGRALPAAADGEAADDPTVARSLARLAGVPRRQAEAWGLYPEPEPGVTPLTGLFRELGRRERVVLPYHGAALWTHLKERRVHPGYLVFGRTARVGPDQVDFCAVLTAIHSLQPEHSALIYRDPATGQLVHASYADLPQFDYYGSGRLGDDLAGVYRQYLQRRDARDLKPLY